MRSTIACVVLFVLTTTVCAGTPVPPGGGSSPADALKQLQQGAAARDIVKMSAVLEPEHRALLLRDFVVLAALLHSGSFEGVTPRKQDADAVNAILDGLIKPALNANPIDPEHLRGHTGDAQATILLGWAISKLPLPDAMRVARVASAAVAGIDHPTIKETLDRYISQVPTEPLTISRQTDTSVWARSGDHPLGFGRVDGRWFVGGVWYETKKVTFTGNQSPSAGASPNVVIDGKPASRAEGPVATETTLEKPITAMEAYAVLRAAAVAAFRGVRLRELQTGIFGVDALGKSPAWFAQFLTDKPGELVSIAYMGGNVLAPSVSSIDESAAAIAGEQDITFDSLKLAQVARDAARAAKVERATKTTAALARSSSTAKPQWNFNVYGHDDRIAFTASIDANSGTLTSVWQRR